MRFSPPSRATPSRSSGVSSGPCSRRDALGLAVEPPSPGWPWRRFIPLTERTVGTQHHYPCSVCVRQGRRAPGARLGSTRGAVREERLVRAQRGLPSDLPALLPPLHPHLQFPALLHAFHIADLLDARDEARRLIAALALLAK